MIIKFENEKKYAKKNCYVYYDITKNKSQVKNKKQNK